MALRGMQDLNVTIDKKNYKSLNYFFKKQSENNSVVDSICWKRFSIFSTEDIICI